MLGRAIVPRSAPDARPRSARARTARVDATSRRPGPAQVLAPGDVVAWAGDYDKHDRVGRVDVAFADALVAVARGRGADVVALGDGPRLREHGFACVRGDGDCATPRAEAAGALRGAAEAAFAAAGARVFSGAFDALCGAETCDHRVPGTSTVAIVDRSHWTTEGSLYVAPFLACWLEGEGLLAS